MMMTRILVPTDFSTRSRAALTRAVQYAQAGRGELLLLHVVEGAPLRWYAVDGLPEVPSARTDPMGHLVLPPRPQKAVHRDLCAEAEWKLAAWLPPQPDRFRTLVTVGKAAEEIVRVAREQRADLIVMGTHGRRGLRRWLRGSVADQVRRQAPVPVVTVGDDGVCLGRFPGQDSGGARQAQDGKTPATREAGERGAPHTPPAGVVPGGTAQARPEATPAHPVTPRRPRRPGRVRRRAASRGRGAADVTPRRS
jgi:nucleotide-binding universal stress UspA family protein